MIEGLEQPEGSQAPANTIDLDPVDNLPEKFKGKTAEEIARSYSELESKMGKDSVRYSEVEKERDALRNYYEQSELQAQRTRQAPAQEPAKDLNWYDHPDEKAQAIVDKRLSETLGKYQRMQDYKNAMEQGEMFKEKAKEKFPHLFKGIDDKDLDSAVYGGLYNGQIAPAFVRSTRAWCGAASLIKGMKTNFSPNDGLNAEPLDQTEMPPQRGKMEYEPKTRLTEEQAVMASFFEDPETGKPYDEKKLMAKIDQTSQSRGQR